MGTGSLSNKKGSRKAVVDDWDFFVGPNGEKLRLSALAWILADRLRRAALFCEVHQLGFFDSVVALLI